MQLRRQHRVDGVGRPNFDFHTGLDYAPFTPEPVRMKAEVANQLKIALVQAAGLTEGSPLVVFEVSSSDKILHRWRSQERKKTPHPVWHQQLAVWKSNFGRPTPSTRRASVAASARWRGGSRRNVVPVTASARWLTLTHWLIPTQAVGHLARRERRGSCTES